MKKWIFIILTTLTCSAYSFSWQSLWATGDQQAQSLMNKGQYKKAEKTFQHPDWRAAAAYRAGHYQDAAKGFAALDSERGYYNQGNALAHMGQYEAAIKAYDEALRFNPDNKDALYNRQIIADLLKKQKESQQNKDQQGQDQKNQQNKNQQGQDQKNQQSKNQQGQDQKNQQNKNQQGQDQQNQQNKNQQGQDQQNQQNKNQQGQDQQNQQNKNQQGQDQQNQQNKDQQGQDQQNQQTADKQQQNKETRQSDQKSSGKKQENSDEAGKTAADEHATAVEREKQLAKEQWLRLIPDDPGGLMREKFLRDHLRRQRGWYQ
ncbi:tetratricopeptide repeat protein [Legionella spiritensis]|uniref:TPR repeat containing protein n=1 Tax=Legionella spiritensis TaxID=452 RepID=A0A0W0ZAT3_LEGSP|nr:tetratricopeptide repeat protein [Legionella spiritensis]KTD66261.1 TPR repeat containing protein [Legionella spiritensis]SNV48379.1 TPR repeat containing protein [Legionella spiritensis]